MTNILHEYPEYLEIDEEITVETLANHSDYITFLVMHYCPATGYTSYDTPIIDNEV